MFPLMQRKRTLGIVGLCCMGGILIFTIISIIWSRHVERVKKIFVTPRTVLLEDNLGVEYRGEMCEWILSDKFGTILPQQDPNTPAEKNIPKNMRSKYTLKENIRVEWDYRNEKTELEKDFKKSFTREDIDEMISDVKKGKYGYYGDVTDSYLYKALRKYSLKGKSVLIVGSLLPWYESIALAYGAESVTTLNYQELVFDHPKIKFYTVSEFVTGSINLPEFDVAISVSSLEHDGLGRYGDPFNPYGDLTSMLRFKCLIKKDGLFFIALPMCWEDVFIWNAHRVYGPERFNMMIRGWEVLDEYGFGDSLRKSECRHARIQPTFVLKNTDFDLYNYVLFKHVLRPYE